MGDTAAPAPTRRQMVTAGLSSVVGFGFDLFDLFVLLYVASTVGPLFFPTSSPTLTPPPARRSRRLPTSSGSTPTAPPR